MKLQIKNEKNKERKKRKRRKRQTVPGGGEQDDPPALTEDKAASTGVFCATVESVGLSTCSGTVAGAALGSKEGLREEGGEPFP